MNGILPLWKPKGMTSHDCVVKIRRFARTKKVGHTGTLDPEVEGVLPICIGQATKIVPFLTDTKKTYIAELFLGTATDTEDRHGEVIASKIVDRTFSFEEIETVLQKFRGVIAQIPPMYSAVKVNGRKLYEYARNNIEVERPKRNVTIHQLEQLTDEPTDQQHIRLRIICSKGTYIRTLCVNIGEELGFPAHMSSLIRTKTGAFSEKDAVDFDMIEKAAASNHLDSLLFPITSGLTHLDTIDADEAMKKRVLFGQKLHMPNAANLRTNPFKLMYRDQLLAVYELHTQDNGVIKPVRVFNE